MVEDEIKRLAVLLNHWIKHNDDHMKEYMKWADVADRHGLKEVAHNLKAAAEFINRSSEQFSTARKEMPVSPEEEGHEHAHDDDHEHHHH